MKKLVSIVLALVMVFSLATVAFAEGETQDYTVLKNAAKFVWGIYQDHVCRHHYITKGWTEKDAANHTHTWKYICVWCGDIVYDEVDCEEWGAVECTYKDNGMTKHYTCSICGNEWDETIDGHTHQFEPTGHYDHTVYNGIPMHYQIYQCKCGYTQNGIPTLCLPLKDNTGITGYSHAFYCPVCYYNFLDIPTAEKVIGDVAATVKAQALEAVEKALNEKINAVLEEVYESLEPNQQTAVDNVWKAINFLADFWTEYYGPNAGNEWWS